MSSSTELGVVPQPVVLGPAALAVLEEVRALLRHWDFETEPEKFPSPASITLLEVLRQMEEFDRLLHARSE